jgi:predicted  nucleic acid-binding Zn-ribbon protein
MEIEIDAAQREADAIEGDQIRAMDDLPLAKERVGACEARHNQEKGTADGYVAELEERHVKASGALQELENRRTGLAKGVNPQHLRVYDRVRTSRWPVIVKLDGGVCGGCHLTQPPAVSHLLRRNAALVTCQMCGRMLYC